MATCSLYVCIYVLTATCSLYVCIYVLTAIVACMYVFMYSLPL